MYATKSNLFQNDVQTRKVVLTSNIKLRMNLVLINPNLRIFMGSIRFSRLGFIKSGIGLFMDFSRHTLNFQNIS